MGSLIALNTIITNNLNPNVSSFFSAPFYFIFFGGIFSFLEKLYKKKSPFHPDEKHLHMLSFYELSKKFGKERGNFLNSIVINLSYFFLILPGYIFFR